MREKLDALFVEEDEIYKGILKETTRQKHAILSGDFKEVEKTARLLEELLKRLSELLLDRKKVLDVSAGSDDSVEEYLQEKVNILKSTVREVLEMNKETQKLLKFNLNFIREHIDIVKSKSNGEVESGIVSNNA